MNATVYQKGRQNNRFSLPFCDTMKKIAINFCPTHLVFLFYGFCNVAPKATAEVLLLDATFLLRFVRVGNV